MNTVPGKTKKQIYLYRRFDGLQPTTSYTIHVATELDGKTVVQVLQCTVVQVLYCTVVKLLYCTLQLLCRYCTVLL